MRNEAESEAIWESWTKFSFCITIVHLKHYNYYPLSSSALWADHDHKRKYKSNKWAGGTPWKHAHVDLDEIVEIPTKSFSDIVGGH